MKQSSTSQLQPFGRWGKGSSGMQGWILAFFLLFISQIASAQLRGLNYQAVAIDENGKESLAQDQLTEVDLERYEGKYNASNNTIVFNIARHAQAILRGTKQNRGFYLVIAEQSPLYVVRRDNFVERIVLAGTSNPSLTPKFNLSYIKLSQDK